jgi:hypothetical protein
MKGLKKIARPHAEIVSLAAKCSASEPVGLLRRLLILFLIFSSMGVHGSDSVLQVLPTLSEVKGLSLSIGPVSARPVVQLFCARLKVERRAFGFLKVGILPELAVEGMELHINRSPDSQTWAGQLRSFLDANPIFREAVIKGFKLQTSNNAFSVTAERARFATGPSRILLDKIKVKGVSFGVKQAGEAVIPLEGWDSGKLRLTRHEPSHIDIFDE